MIFWPSFWYLLKNIAELIISSFDQITQTTIWAHGDRQGRRLGRLGRAVLWLGSLFLDVRNIMLGYSVKVDKRVMLQTFNFARNNFNGQYTSVYTFFVLIQKNLRCILIFCLDHIFYKLKSVNLRLKYKMNVNGRVSIWFRFILYQILLISALKKPSNLFWSKNDQNGWKGAIGCRVLKTSLILKRSIKR